MSKWVNLFYFEVGEHVIFLWDNDDICFVLGQHAKLNCYTADYWNNNSQVDMSLHSDTSHWFWVNQSICSMHYTDSEQTSLYVACFNCKEAAKQILCRHDVTEILLKVALNK
jgi:hypothetical protein